MNLAYRWLLGYGLLDKTPYFATVSYAFCRRFPDKLMTAVFEYILDRTLNNGMVNPSTILTEETHIKAGTNKKKLQKHKWTYKNSN